MENLILTIERDVAQNPQVASRRSIPYIWALLLVAGVAAGAFSRTLTPDRADLSSALLFCGFAAAVVGLIGVVRPRRRLVWLPTGERVFRHSINLDPANRARIEQLIDKGDIDTLQTMRVDRSTSLMLTIYSTRSRSFGELQLFEYVPHQYVPARAPQRVV